MSDAKGTKETKRRRNYETVLPLVESGLESWKVSENHTIKYKIIIRNKPKENITVR